MEQYIIGLDIGTGSTKAVAINYSGEVIASSQFHYSGLDAPQGYSEQDPEIIWKAFRNCLIDVTNILKQVPFAVSFSSCMHSLIIIDKNNLPLTNLITWADTRSEKIAEEIRQSAMAETIYRQSGTPIHSMSPLCKIIWFCRNEPKIFTEAFKFISIKEFIWYRLFGVYEIDQSIASATGLFNIETSLWNQPSLQLCGINVEKLSAIVPTNFMRTNVIPERAKELKIAVVTTFCIGASDGCLANIGSLAVEKGVAALTIGTSAAVRIAHSSPVFNFGAMIFNYVLEGGTFICGTPVNNGGNVLEWMMKNFLENINPVEKDYLQFFNKVANTEAGCKGLIFLPYLYGERAPVWDEKASAVFFGIKSFHTQSHFSRAAIEGVCYALKNIIEIIEASTGAITQLNVSGGFIHSDVWVQILADLTGKKICIIQAEDASSYGAAMLCMKAMNIIENYQSLKPADEVIIKPIEENVVAHDKYYPVFKKLYGDLKDSMHTVNEIKNRAD
ncbi:MAG: gluconokinase [Ginsengibacter sp.]